ncbi:MAG: NAD(P)H-dependent oxidoreductase [Candidatus Omnitrophota bacterium]
MKTAIVYYSKTGFTHKVSSLLKEQLAGSGNQVDVFRIKQQKPEGTIVHKCVSAVMGTRPLIKDAKTDMEEYDLVFIGGPIWALSIPPAVKSYMSKLNGILGKRVGLFLTYGSGAGKNRTIDGMEKTVCSKGALRACKFLVSDFKVATDPDYIKKSLRNFTKRVAEK